MMRAAGIDIGSITAKAALIEDGRLIWDGVHLYGIQSGACRAKKVYDELLHTARLDAAEVEKVVSTGYGRSSVKFADRSYTEIMCHAAGAHFLNPLIRSVIDMRRTGQQGHSD